MTPAKSFTGPVSDGNGDTLLDQGSGVGVCAAIEDAAIKSTTRAAKLFCFSRVATLCIPLQDCVKSRKNTKGVVWSSNLGRVDPFYFDDLRAEDPYRLSRERMARGIGKELFVRRVFGEAFRLWDVV